MSPEIVVVISIFASFIALEMIKTGFFTKPNQKAGDGTVELISTMTLSLLRDLHIVIHLW